MCSGGMQTKIKFDLVFVISTFKERQANHVRLKGRKGPKTTKVKVKVISYDDFWDFLQDSIYSFVSRHAAGGGGNVWATWQAGGS